MKLTIKLPRSLWERSISKQAYHPDEVKAQDAIRKAFEKANKKGIKRRAKAYKKFRAENPELDNFGQIN